jgi:hypothetical protein
MIMTGLLPLPSTLRIKRDNPDKSDEHSRSVTKAGVRDRSHGGTEYPL